MTRDTTSEKTGTQSMGKRKALSDGAQSNKRIKTQPTSLDGLPWKAVKRKNEAGVDGVEGILELEEVDDVEVIYEETPAGKVIKFNVLETSQKYKTDQHSIDGSSTPQISGSGEASSTKTGLIGALQALTFDSENLLPQWHEYSLHPHLLQMLHHKQFLSPTPIQSKSLPLALSGNDVIGVAETGSGKTLAYGLPILQHLVSSYQATRLTNVRKLSALILTPTRELALQVSEHLNIFSRMLHVAVKEEDVARSLKIDASKNKLKSSESKEPLVVSIAAVVGGMSAQKQRRVLNRGVDILIATPGRLWDILEEYDSLAHQIKNLRFLVLDEADRMVEAGHFAELDNILRLTIRQSEEPEIGEDPGTELLTSEKPQPSDIALQTFVFSATLSKDLQRNLKKKSHSKGPKKGSAKAASTLDDLLLRLDFRDPEPRIIDISPEGGVVSTLQESKIECISSDKDIYLYYFLLRYPGRSLVFLSSVDGIRRLMPLMTLLQLEAFPLHSQLEQRQRLKNLDRFKSTENAVLLATDIAARGLDIPAVDHVIHYQIPRTTDAFIHRNGRTARAMRKGFSLLLCAPDERKIVKALMHNLGRQETDIPDISVELTLLDKLKARIQVARQIDLAQHKEKKRKHDKNWIKETAEAMEIELDSDFLSQSEDENKQSRRQTPNQNARVAELKAELHRLLSRPLVAHGVIPKYITSGSRPIADDLIAGNYHRSMLGLKNTDAGQDLVSARQGKPKAKTEEPDEWTGFNS